MARCKLCDKSGLFLKTSYLGLCSSCQNQYDFTVPRLVEIWQESTKIMSTTQNLVTKVLRCETALSSLYKIRNFGAGSFDAIYVVTKENRVSDTIVLYESMLSDLKNMVCEFEKIIFGILDEHGSATKQKIMEVINNNLNACERSSDDLSYNIDKSIAGILEQLEYENRIRKEKMGNKNIYFSTIK